MAVALTCHPDTPCDAVSAIEVEVGYGGGTLVLRYGVTGRIADLAIPPIAWPDRTDELWRHTCFEAFLRPVGTEAYLEFNFAPSTQWAAYRFDSYRAGMARADGDGAPQFEVQSHAATFTMQILLPLAPLPNPVPRRLALSAVIEETNGRKSYWAVRHPAGKPDFHHPDCFALEIPAASGA